MDDPVSLIASSFDGFHYLRKERSIDGSPPYSRRARRRAGGEVGFSVRSADDKRTLLHGHPIAAMPMVYLTPKIEDRSVEVQLALAQRGQHRAPSIPDLLIAATPQLSEFIVLQLDKDFELISDLTGQPTARLTLS